MSEWLFSNFQPVEIKFDKITYPSVEHYYQAQKASSVQQKARIAQLPTAALAKKAGRSLIVPKDWNSSRLTIMRIGLQKKFSQEPFKLLLKYFNGEIVEYNTWHDNFWGGCICTKCMDITHENNLGKLLMEIRNELNNS